MLPREMRSRSRNPPARVRAHGSRCTQACGDWRDGLNVRRAAGRRQDRRESSRVHCTERRTSLNLIDIRDCQPNNARLVSGLPVIERLAGFRPSLAVIGRGLSPIDPPFEAQATGGILVPHGGAQGAAPLPRTLHEDRLLDPTTGLCRSASVWALPRCGLGTD